MNLSSTDPVFLIASVVLGLLWGSFLNVLIYRLPRKKSVVMGRSHCPGCERVIAWYDNVPLVSYLLLRGRCRRCDFRIPKSYPLVEALSAVAVVGVAYRYGPALEALWWWLFVSALLVITFIDWFHRIIPDELSVGGMVFGWIGAVVCLDISLLESFIGSLVGGGTLLLIAVGYRALRKIEGMGGGDIKLMAMIGAFLGWQMVFPVLFVASFFGAAYGILLMTRGGTGTTAVAFGSFLAPAATLVMALGSRIFNFYYNF